MKILDRYIVRQFLVSFFFGLLAVLLIFVIIDMMEKLDDFIDANASTSVIVEYYIAFLPEIIKLMTPVAVLLAALFVTGRMSGQNELAAMKSSGISLYRSLAPYLIVSIIITGFSIYLNGWIVPYANQKKLYIERTYLHRGGDVTVRYNIVFLEGRTRIVSVNYYDTQSRTASRVSIEDFDSTDVTRLVRRYDAAQMRWTPTPGGGGMRGTWVLVSGTERHFDSTGQSLSTFQRLPIGTLALTPTDIERKQRTPDEMDYADLREFIRSQERAGQDVSRWLVEYHSKVAFPFASVIMILFGVPFASSRPRTGAALGFGISVAITFTYLIFMKVSQVFGYNGDLDPLVTAWLANLIFLAAGIVNIFRVQK